MSRFLFSAAVAVSLAAVARADVGFTGVAAGDATDTAAIVWTRLDDATAAHNGIAGKLSVQLSTDGATFKTVIADAANWTAEHDYVYKSELTGLLPAKKYFYRFSAGTTVSPVGTFKTAPDAKTAAPVRIAFSGDAHGAWRP